MEKVRISAQMLGDRLDARYNAPSAVAVREYIANSGLPTDKVGEVFKELTCGPFGSTLTANEHSADGNVLLIQPTNISSELFSDDTSWRITEKKLREKSLPLYPAGTFLFARVGIYPHVGVLPEWVGSATISSSMIAGIPNGKADPYFLLSFFRGQYGQPLLFAAQKVTAQPTIGTYEIESTMVPIPSERIQTYIGDKVRQAERLRERARKLRDFIKSKMQKCFRSQPRPLLRKFSKVSTSDLLTLRMEPEFYSPFALWAEEEIKNTPWNYKPLAALSKRIKDGPGGWGVSTNDYVQEGIPVIRGVNLIDGICDLADCVFLSRKKHVELLAHCVKPQSVLLSVRGTIGRAAVFCETPYQEANLNAAVVTIDCTEEILPHYLAEFLNTEIGIIQTQRLANGAVQKNMNLQETGSNLIVIAPMDFQEEISELRSARILAYHGSNNLVITAKLLVEALIEGSVTEAELKAAQEALERGDRSLDREILKRLTRKGIDVADEPPLFADLDALYQALDSTTEG